MMTPACYPGMGCDQRDCTETPQCYTGPFTDSEHDTAPVLTAVQCEQLGISAADAADAAAWARAYGPLTDDQRNRLRAAGTALPMYLNGG